MSLTLHDFQVPLSAESVGRLFPRTWLNWLEINTRPRPVPKNLHLQNVAYWQGRKVALVKQTAYHALYEGGAFPAWQDRVLSAGGHLGPFALFSDFNADFWVVAQEPDPECFAWEEKYAYTPGREEKIRERRALLGEMEAACPEKFPRCGDLDWGRYELVISLDLAVPERLVRKYPETAWAYFSTEPGSPLQKKSLRAPLAGYDFFLNHGFRGWRSRPVNRRHVLEFPFSFQSKRAWNELAGRLGSEPPGRAGVLVEQFSWQDPLPPCTTHLQLLRGQETSQYVRSLRSHRYAVRTDPRKRWGNWAVEAILAGCLFIGRADSLDHPNVLLAPLTVPNLASACPLVNRIEREGWAPALSTLQQEKTEEVAFRRPWADLTSTFRMWKS
jgi:hypothetical protein